MAAGRAGCPCGADWRCRVCGDAFGRGKRPFHYGNRSKFQAPENASIARFQGLCCYQIRSEIGDGFRGAGTGRERRPPMRQAAR